LIQDLTGAVKLCGLAISSEHRFPLNDLKLYITQFPMIMKMIEKESFFIACIGESLEDMIIGNASLLSPAMMNATVSVIFHEIHQLQDSFKEMRLSIDSLRNLTLTMILISIVTAIIAIFALWFKP
jgi:hypothetical protein